MNIDSFLERWNRMGKQRQLITVLMALIKQVQMTEVAIPLDALDTIGSGESLLMIQNGTELILRYAPEQTELLTIQESTGGSPWTTNTPSPYAKSASSSVLDDQHLAQAEQRKAEAQKARVMAQKLRTRGLENLTDDVPPLT